ncbi:MAG: methionyl-tRNA formyltransferase [Gammaproteobacteria bacterium]|nr:methionyl-tRNA formyltransferase [Gammaproteobacteria bacterium]MBT4494610.1 methionyl-tRNA formyltransferase [Gammaproteobacteria bacterium]MBT7371458.1 methionyl-tRNA formyltransferase [Gammaproteobacteria bacterium]
MKVAFAGTPDFAAGHLRALIECHHEVVVVVTQPDKPGKRGKKPIASPVKKLAVSHELICLQPQKLTADDLSTYEFDALIVVAYGQILKIDVLSLPRHGCINVHASLLPRWRGAAPVQRAILAGDHETGVTIIQMDEGLDTGDMLAAEPITIKAGDTAAKLFQKMLDSGQRLLIETIDEIEAGTVQAVKQPIQDTVYAAKIDKDEALIDWEGSSNIVDRKVRAFQPDPITYTYLGDMRVKVHAGTEDSDKEGIPGEVLEVSKQGILVACGKGAYRITEIQLPVGKGTILKPADVLNGRTDILHAGVFLNSRAP